MSLTSRLAKVGDRLTLVAIRTLLKETRAFRKVLEAGIDSYREVNRLPPLFAAPLPTPEESPYAYADSDGKEPWRFLKPGDYQTQWVLEELAIEFRVRTDENTDWERLAIDRGWVNEQGRLVMLPASASRMDEATKSLIGYGAPDAEGN